MLIHIQILRFLAAAAVVAFHAWSMAPSFIKIPEGLSGYGLQYGGNGVDLFFVISGFIIYYATQRTFLTPKRFLQRRLERIVPLYYFVMIAVIMLAFLFPANFDTPGWFALEHTLKSFGFVSFTDGVMPVVYVGWSLEYEMYFYLCLALLMALTSDPWRAVVTLFSMLTIVGQLPGMSDAIGNYNFFFNPLILEFATGVLVRKVFLTRRIGRIELGAASCALAVLVVIDPSNRVILFGLPSAILVGSASFMSYWRSNPSRLEMMLARLGDASYSIYLAQVNTVWIASMYLAKLAPNFSPYALVIVTAFIVVAVGLLLNVLVERPLVKMCRVFATPRVQGAAA